MSAEIKSVDLQAKRFTTIFKTSYPHGTFCSSIILWDYFFLEFWEDGEYSTLLKEKLLEIGAKIPISAGERLKFANGDTVRMGVTGLCYGESPLTPVVTGLQSYPLLLLLFPAPRSNSSEA